MSTKLRLVATLISSKDIVMQIENGKDEIKSTSGLVDTYLYLGFSSFFETYQANMYVQILYRI